MGEQEQEQKKFSLAGHDDNEVVQFDHAIIVGRASQGMLANSQVEVSFVIDEDGVSRVHARISPEETGVWVEDLGSANGTFVNDQRVTEKIRAVNGDHIRFDLQEFKLIEHGAGVGEGSSQSDSADSQAPAVRPVEEAVAEASDNEGRKGATVIMPINRNLPPAWIDHRKPGTVLVRAEDMEEPSEAPDAETLEEEVDAPTLLILSGDGAGRPFKLECSDEINFWNIGKDAAKHDLSIVIDDSSVSDFHAKLVRQGDRWKIIDQMSTNHTYINGEHFNAAYLASKDHIRFGQVESLFLLPKAAGKVVGDGQKRGVFRRLLNSIGIGE